MFQNVQRVELSMQDYQSYNALSRSGIIDLLTSFKRYAYNKANPRKKTPALILGSAIHDYVLERDTFGKRYIVAPQCDRRTKEGKAIWAEFEAKAEGLTLLSEDDFNTCAEVGKTCEEHPVISKLLKSQDREITLIGEYFINGEVIAVKCRFDLLLSVDGVSYAFDLKSCLDCGIEAFSKDITNHQYHVQAAFYLDMLNAYLCSQGKQPAPSFMFGAVEKDGPFDAAVYELDQVSFELGRSLYKKGIERLYKSMRENAYQGVSQEIKTISVKSWAFYGNEELV